MRIRVIILLVSVLTLSAAAQDFKALNKEAADAYNARKYAEALEKSRIALDKSSNGWNDNESIVRIGNSLRELKRYDEAIEWFNQIADLPDINDNTRLRRFEFIGDVYWRQQDFAKAKECFQAFLTQSTDSRTWANMQEKLARLCRQTKENDEAIRYYRSALLNPDPYYWAVMSSRRQLGEIYLAEKKYPEVLALFKDIDFKKYTNRGELRNAGDLCGQAAFQLQDYPKTIEYFSLYPENNNRKSLHLGQANLALKKYNDARKSLSPIANNKKNNARERAEALIYIGDSFRDENKNTEAEKRYREALSISNDNNQKSQLNARLEALKPQK